MDDVDVIELHLPYELAAAKQSGQVWARGIEMNGRVRRAMDDDRINRCRHAAPGVSALFGEKPYTHRVRLSMEMQGNGIGYAVRRWCKQSGIVREA